MRRHVTPKQKINNRKINKKDKIQLKGNDEGQPEAEAPTKNNKQNRQEQTN